jgi:hypothetical protein
MRRNSTWRATAVAAALLAFGVSTPQCLAQTPSTDWRFDAVLYGYLPQLSGSATFATGTPSDITVDPKQLIHGLNFAFMGAFEANKGPWGVFTDLIYVHASGSQSATRSLSIGGVAIPSSVTADARLDVKSTIWTLAGEYRVVSAPEATLDFLIGTRALYLDQHLSWTFSSDVGPFVGPERQGASKFNPNNWDGIVGAKGRWMFGDGHAWFVPAYLDIGTGASQLTWQGIGGIGYAFSWGEVLGVWRYLDYHFSSHSSTLAFNGPALGVAFRW